MAEVVTKEYFLKTKALERKMYEERFRAIEEQLKAIIEQGEGNELSKG
jgi:hypothetical protein